MSIQKRCVALVLACWFTVPCLATDPNGGYAVVVSKATLDKPEWKKVVDALIAKHKGQVIVYEELAQVRAGLAKQSPRYACFVATSAETTRQFVAEVHRLTRQLDDDPYTDVIWGILTGYDAANALRTAQEPKPLIISRVASGTEVALDMCEEGVWYSELKQQQMVRKQPGQKPQAESGPADTTRALANTLNDFKADLLVTSGHANERTWQIGYSYRNGTFQSKAGKLFGVDTQQSRIEIQSDNPKVYLPVGNCLMGHINGPDAMALAFMNSAGVRQMIGYTVETAYGYAGWGCLDYFVEQPGRFTFAEAFYANHQALLHKLETEYPNIARTSPNLRSSASLLTDRDVVAFYGDPAWEARLKPGPLAWTQELTEKDGVYTFTITPQRGDKTFAPINTNGSQRGGRPIFEFLPRRVQDVQILEGGDLKPLVTDNFLLVPLPKKYERDRVYKIVFTAAPMK